MAEASSSAESKRSIEDAANDNPACKKIKTEPPTDFQQPSTSGTNVNSTNEQKCPVKKSGKKVSEGESKKYKVKSKKKGTSQAKKKEDEFSDNNSGRTVDLHKRGLPNCIDKFGIEQNGGLDILSFMPSHINLQLLIVREVALEGRHGITFQGISNTLSSKRVIYCNCTILESRFIAAYSRSDPELPTAHTGGRRIRMERHPHVQFHAVLPT